MRRRRDGREREMHMRSSHGPQSPARLDGFPRGRVGPVDNFARAIGVCGQDGREQVFARDGEGVALGRAD